MAQKIFIESTGLRAFIATVEQGSITKAAKTLRTSHPTVSRAIASLEDDLGYELFSRGGIG